MYLLKENWNYLEKSATVTFMASIKSLPLQHSTTIIDITTTGNPHRHSKT